MKYLIYPIIIISILFTTFLWNVNNVDLENAYEYLTPSNHYTTSELKNLLETQHNLKNVSLEKEISFVEAESFHCNEKHKVYTFYTDTFPDIPFTAISSCYTSFENNTTQNINTILTNIDYLLTKKYMSDFALINTNFRQLLENVYFYKQIIVEFEDRQHLNEQVKIIQSFYDYVNLQEYVPHIPIFFTTSSIPYAYTSSIRMMNFEDYTSPNVENNYLKTLVDLGLQRNQVFSDTEIFDLTLTSQRYYGDYYDEMPLIFLSYNDNQPYIFPDIVTLGYGNVYHLALEFGFDVQGDYNDFSFIGLDENEHRFFITESIHHYYNAETTLLYQLNQERHQYSSIIQNCKVNYTKNGVHENIFSVSKPEIDTHALYLMLGLTRLSLEEFLQNQELPTSDTAEILSYLNNEETISILEQYKDTYFQTPSY